jgi:alkanesulfonate monooxygenase SsuD/methylene tetrahydromethanopterin reductase-like flavin-dependent oxidoreductase (luciferase family)
MEAAVEAFYPSWFDAMSRIGRERGWRPVTRAQFDALISPEGALLVGDPATVIRKLLREYALFGNTRFCFQFTLGTIPHAKVLRAIELLGTVVAPAVRAELARHTRA